MGSLPAIRVENVSKRYLLGMNTGGASYSTFRDALVSLVKKPFASGTASGRNVDDFWALNDVSFEIQPGEVVGIIGRNGAGKSTLLKILSRITKPTRGRVELNGRIGSLLEVGTGFHPELTGRENIYLNGSILGMRRREIEKKFDDIVSFAEVSQFLDTPVKRYSSGMYVRLAFAVAAHLEPEILIVDEVLAVGDAAFQNKCIAKMKECAVSGRTVLLVSHHMKNVIDLCHKVIWLDHGTVKQCGPVMSIMEDYLAANTGNKPHGETIDLTHSPRRGTREVLIEAAEYYGEDPTQHIISGGGMTVEMNVNSKITSTDTVARASIWDKMGTLLIETNTFCHNGQLHLQQGKSTISFVIDQLHLRPGSYRVTLAIGSSQDYYDQISEAFTIEVYPNDKDSKHLCPVYGYVTSDFHTSIKSL